MGKPKQRNLKLGLELVICNDGMEVQPSKTIASKSKYGVLAPYRMGENVAICEGVVQSVTC
jgi:hypothetical protein